MHHVFSSFPVFNSRAVAWGGMLSLGASPIPAMKPESIAKLNKALQDARSIHGRVDKRNRDGSQTTTQRGAVSTDRFKGAPLSPEEKMAEKVVNAFALLATIAGEDVAFAVSTTKPAAKQPAAKQPAAKKAPVTPPAIAPLRAVA